MKKPRPLITRLRAARILLREERSVLYDSERFVDGSVAPDVAQALARFDEAGAAVAEAVKLLKEQEPAKPVRRLMSCGYCSFEEADGSLIEQCRRCKGKFEGAARG